MLLTMRKTIYYIQSTTILSALIIALLPSGIVRAAEQVTRPSSRILITEIQTGAASAGDEFIELYNPSSVPVNITGWQLRYLNASTSGLSTSLVSEIKNPDASQVILMPASYFVLHTATVPVNSAAIGQIYSAKLSNADKTVALFAPNISTCNLEPYDSVGWGSTLGGENGALSTEQLHTNTTSGRHIQRYRGNLEPYVDTNVNSLDYAIRLVTPRNDSMSLSTDSTPGSYNESPTLSVELENQYGPVNFDLEPVNISGCALSSSLDNSDNILGLGGTVMEPEGLQDINGSSNNSQANIAAPDSNSAIQPQTSNNTYGVVPPSGQYETILLPPSISELLPDPEPPLTDADNEFIELYNPNDSILNLENYSLRVGTSRTYTFGSGDSIGPKSFMALESSRSGLALSNSGSTVALFGPDGIQIGDTVSYPAAKTGQSWSCIDGIWQWTSLSTFGTKNAPTPAVVLASMALPKVTRVTKAKKKTTKITKSVSKTKPKASSKAKKSTSASTKLKDTAKSTLAVAPASSRQPMHTGVLALVGGFALLYGAYEYRGDLANRIRKFRKNRSNS